MTKTKGLLLAVAVAAMAFTFSCSSGDDNSGGGDPSSSSGGTLGGGSSSSGGDGNACTADFGEITIGSQTWAKKNLNCDVAGSKCYGDNPANCTTYGRLYDWATAMTACPSGWRLPNNYDWDALITAIGGKSMATKLKETSGWNDDGETSGNGTNESEFSALPGGLGTTDNIFDNIGKTGSWWTVSEYNSDDATMQIYIRNNGYLGFDRWKEWNFDYGAPMFSVRCIKD